MDIKHTEITICLKSYIFNIAFRNVLNNINLINIVFQEDLENKINCLNISLQSIKFDFIKYRQTKTCTDNSETYERIK